MKTINYKGYQASVEYDDGTLFVKVLHIDDLLVAECDSASDAPKALADLVDAYLDDCAELGREPTKPFKGTFNVRVGPGGGYVHSASEQDDESAPAGMLATSNG